MSKNLKCLCARTVQSPAATQSSTKSTSKASELQLLMLHVSCWLSEAP